MPKRDTIPNLRDAVRAAILDDATLVDILEAIKDEYEGIQGRCDDEGDETTYYQDNADTVQDMIDSLP